MLYLKQFVFYIIIYLQIVVKCTTKLKMIDFELILGDDHQNLRNFETDFHS